MIIQPGTHAILNADLSFREVRMITVPTEAAEGRTRPVVMTAQPSFNAATQKAVQTGWSINTEDATPIWEVVALSAAELDAIANAAEAAIVKNAIAVFKAGTATNAQAQRAIAYLLKQSLG